jgi:hypothetical protein
MIFLIEYYHTTFFVECDYTECKGDRETPPEELLEDVLLTAVDFAHRGFATFLNHLIDADKMPESLQETILSKCRSRR